jgi:hypothetical protein
MKKNNLILLASIIVIAVALIFALDKYSGTDSKTVGPSLTSTTQAELNAKCKNLETSSWNPGEYASIKADIEVNKSQSNISETDYNNLLEHLQVAYASVLRKAANQWQSSCEPINSNLESEINKLAALTPCKDILSPSQNLFNAYRKIASLNSIVGNFLNQEYNEGRYDALVANLNAYCKASVFSSCSNVAAIYTNELSRLNQFKTFANKYNSAKSMYLHEPWDRYKIRTFKNLCPSYSTEINEYQFYLNDISNYQNILNC